MKRRVFVAIGISSQLKEEIAAWQKEWNHLSVRWIKPENLHVTLIPPWYVGKIDELINLLKSCKNIVEPFTITFREVMFGPSPKKPRLIWASGDVVPEIIALKSKLEEALSPRHHVRRGQTWLAQKREKRPFLTHLTIARFKEKDFTKFPAKTLPRTMSVRGLHDKIFWKEKVHSFLLMESHLRRSGAEYETLYSLNF